MAWRLAQSRGMETVFVAPGNAGTALEPRLRNLPLTAPDPLALFAEREKVDFTIVGPEGPLADGIVDVFRARGLPIFGPTKAAAQLESSKDFAKAFMKRHSIPTAAYRTFTDPVDAKAYISGRGAPIVVKADGLAAGKGVVVAETVAEAHAAVDRMLGTAATAGARVVVEEFLQGEEASFIVMVDGRNVLTLASSQDHKRLLDGDKGPNTGGMGAYSPTPIITPDINARVLREIVMPTVAGMAADGIPFSGFLYAGLMIDRDGAPKVIEFNVRFGDPETQPVMMRLQSDLLDLVEAAIAGRLASVQARWDPRPAVGVVMAAENYPGTPRTGDPIGSWDVPEVGDSKVFHAGTGTVDGQVVTTGGRVLCVCALGATVGEAQRHAYEAVAGISWHGEFHRHDIGWRAIEREQAGRDD